MITNLRMDLFEALVMTLHLCASVVWEPGDQVDATVSAPFIVTRISNWVDSAARFIPRFSRRGCTLDNHESGLCTCGHWTMELEVCNRMEVDFISLLPQLC